MHPNYLNFERLMLMAANPDEVIQSMFHLEKRPLLIAKKFSQDLTFLDSTLVFENQNYKYY